jgi:hypothetical protein
LLDNDTLLYKRIEAINSFRLGYITDGLLYWYDGKLNEPMKEEDMQVRGYNSAQPERFKADMQLVIKKLEEMGQ